MFNVFFYGWLIIAGLLTVGAVGFWIYSDVYTNPAGSPKIKIQGALDCETCKDPFSEDFIVCGSSVKTHMLEQLRTDLIRRTATQEL